MDAKTVIENVAKTHVMQAENYKSQTRQHLLTLLQRTQRAIEDLDQNYDAISGSNGLTTAARDAEVTATSWKQHALVVTELKFAKDMIQEDLEIPTTQAELDLPMVHNPLCEMPGHGHESA